LMSFHNRDVLIIRQAAIAVMVQQHIAPVPTVRDSRDEVPQRTNWPPNKTDSQQNRQSDFEAHGSSEALRATKDKAKVKAEMEPQNFDLSPASGNYQSDLGLFLDATSTKVSRLPDPSRGEWGVIIARRQGSLEVWALSPEGSVALLGGLSRRRSFDFALGTMFGLFLYFVFLVYM
jgi:hypothetical protein